MPPSQRVLLLAAATAVLLITLIVSISTTSWTQPAIRSVRALGKADLHLHLILPATAVNLNLCRLLLSGLITGYPEPIFLGWGGHGQYDGAKSHLFKISETLKHLDSLPPSADDDLVLLLDAYDIWLQLRPDVLLSRYFNLIDKANQRLKDDGIFGKQYGGSEVRQTIVFATDKTCWPDYATRAACWAMPESTMSQISFGPATDSWMVPNRPRWLNSGTIIGPVKDVRDMFKGTMDILEMEYDENFRSKTSDQYYFQDVMANQELARIRLKNGTVTAPVVGHNKTTGKEIFGYIPDLGPEWRTEYHITLDYDTDIFQTAAAYTEYITWMSFNHSTPSHVSEEGARRRIDQMTLPKDIERSPKPFASIEKNAKLPLHHGWRDLMLGMNGVTETVFPLFHMTGDKSYRDRWWPRMWFQSHGKELAKAARLTAPYAGDAQLVAKVNGVRWLTPTIYRTSNKTTLHDDNISRGGGWTDQGDHFTWDELCSAHEEKLFQ